MFPAGKPAGSRENPECKPSISVMKSVSREENNYELIINNYK